MDLPERPTDRLLAIMRVLRGSNGCPWDRQQTLDSLKRYLLEECHEEIEAVESGDRDRIREELGDVLLQVVFQAQICADHGWFDFEDVARTIADKLVRRHPHVFGDATARDAEAVLRNWEAIKRAEAGEDSPPRSAVEGLPRSLPALRRADQVQQRAARVGFDWPDRTGIFAKLDEELAELRHAVEEGDPPRLQEEVGDVLFTIVNLARAWGVDPEQALQQTTDKFIRRFRHMEAAAARAGRPLADHSPAELDALWEAAKRDERTGPPAGDGD